MTGAVVSLNEDRAAMIRDAIAYAQRIGLTVAESAKMLGYSHEVAANPKYLERELIDNGKGNNVEERCELFLDIKDVLADRFQENYDAIKHQIRDQHPQFKGRCARSFIVSGRLDDLKFAKALLQTKA